MENSLLFDIFQLHWKELTEIKECEFLQQHMPHYLLYTTGFRCHITDFKSTTFAAYVLTFSVLLLLLCWKRKVLTISTSKMTCFVLLCALSVLRSPLRMALLPVLFLFFQFPSPLYLELSVLHLLIIYFIPYYFPSVLSIFLFRYFSLKKSLFHLTSSLYLISMAVTFLLFSSHYLLFCGTWLQDYKSYYDLSQLNCVPTYGVLWYVHALMLEEYRVVISLILGFLPWICALFLPGIFNYSSADFKDMVSSFLRFRVCWLC
jgi:hypothetical protein